MPLSSRTFSQLIDFTRTSAATFVNSSGNIASTPQSRNLLTFTNEFANAAWTKTRSSITANSTAAPDGTNTADTLTAQAATGNHAVETAVSFTSGLPYAISVYAKAGTSSFLQIMGFSTPFGVNAFANFNLASGAVGTVGSSATASIQSVGNGWYRCVMVATATGTGTGFAYNMVQSATSARNESWTAAGTETLFIWGAQLEQASSATDYTRNFGGLFPPRFDYDPVTRAPRGLLIEEQRTNLLLRSEEFDNAAWSKINGSVTANATTSPDGTVDADLFIPNTTAAVQHRIDQTPVSSAVAQVFSVFVKASGYTWISLRVGSVGRAFDIVNGTVGTNGTMTGTITSFGNGWYRCAIAVPSPLANDICRINVENGDAIASVFAGDGTSGIFLYGAQLEAGAFATSYIPTVASQVTRTADVAAINAPNFASWYNQSEGTILVEAVTFKPTTVAATGLAVDVSDGGVNNRHYIGANGATAEGRTVVGGVTQVSIFQTYTANATEKLAYAYKVNDFAFFRNGSQVGTDTSGTIPTVDRMFIGNAAGSAAFWNGWLRSIRYYPTRLTQAQGQALTA